MRYCSEDPAGERPTGFRRTDRIRFRDIQALSPQLGSVYVNRHIVTPIADPPLDTPLRGEGDSDAGLWPAFSRD